MRVLSGARINSAEASRVEMALADGFRLILHFLDSHLARALIVPPGGLQMPRTWSLSPELAGEDAIDGRDRLDLTGFPGSEIRAVTETEAAIAIETALIRVEVRRSPLALTWSFRPSAEAAFEPLLQDRQTQAYCYRRGGRALRIIWCATRPSIITASARKAAMRTRRPPLAHAHRRRARLRRPNNRSAL